MTLIISFSTSSLPLFSYRLKNLTNSLGNTLEDAQLGLPRIGIGMVGCAPESVNMGTRLHLLLPLPEDRKYFELAAEERIYQRARNA